MTTVRSDVGGRRATYLGKTTMLNALAGSIPPRERVITCEEVFELRMTARLHTFG